MGPGLIVPSIAFEKWLWRQNALTMKLYMRKKGLAFVPSIPVQMKSTTKARLLYMLQKMREERQHSLAPRLKTVKKVKLEATEGR